MGAENLNKDGNRYVYVFVLLYSRYIIVELTPARTDKLMIKCFKSAILKAGHTPEMLRPDHGGEFESQPFNNVCKDRLNPIRREFSNAREQHVSRSRPLTKSADMLDYLPFSVVSPTTNGDTRYAMLQTLSIPSPTLLLVTSYRS